VALAWLKIVGARPLVLLIGAEFRIDYARTSQNSWIPLLLQTLQDFAIESVVLDSGDFPSFLSSFSIICLQAAGT
jgi:hypothetical protein